MRMITCLSLLLVVFLNGKAQPPDSANFNAGFKGVCFVAPKNELKTNPFEPIKQLGANYVAVIPYAYCRPGNPEVKYDYPRQWWGETVEGARQTIEYAREKGLKVMLKPHLWVGGEGWPGSLSFDNEVDWGTWQSSYTDFILRYAEIAEAMDVEVLTIGTECKQLVRERPEFWRFLIRKVRQVYGGKLTYQANWDNYKAVSFWDQLVYISVSGYFPLTDEDEPADSVIAKGWENPLKSLKQMHLAYDKPVMFGEYGYRSKKGALAKPWEGSRESPEPVDLNAQKNGYAMLFQQVWTQPWFNGGFLWKWHADHQNAGGPKNNRYTPQNKPAEKLIERFYQGH